MLELGAVIVIAWVQSVVGELRSHKLHAMATKKEKKKICSIKSQM